MTDRSVYHFHNKGHNFLCRDINFSVTEGMFYRNEPQKQQTCAVVKVTGYMIMKFTQLNQYFKNIAPNRDWSSLFLNITL